MRIPHNGKIIIVDQLTHYESRASPSPNNMLHFVGSQQKLLPSFTKFGAKIFKYSTLIGTYPRDPPIMPSLTSTIVCVINASLVELS